VGFSAGQPSKSCRLFDIATALATDRLGGGLSSRDANHRQKPSPLCKCVARLDSHAGGLAQSSPLGHRPSTTLPGNRRRLPGRSSAGSPRVAVSADAEATDPCDLGCTRGRADPTTGSPPEAAHHSRHHEWSSPPHHPTAPCVANGVGGRTPWDTLNRAAGHPLARILMDGTGKVLAGTPSRGYAFALRVAASFLATAAPRVPSLLPRRRRRSWSAATCLVLSSINGQSSSSSVVSTPTAFHRAL
jgi:hypothetical protein